MLVKLPKPSNRYTIMFASDFKRKLAISEKLKLVPAARYC